MSKAPQCILDSGCPWSKEGNCRTFGECGAAYALERAREPGGYEVLRHNNRTIGALLKADLVKAVPTDDGTLIVKALGHRTGTASPDIQPQQPFVVP